MNKPSVAFLIALTFLPRLLGDEDPPHKQYIYRPADVPRAPASVPAPGGHCDHIAPATMAAVVPSPPCKALQFDQPTGHRTPSTREGTSGRESAVREGAVAREGSVRESVVREAVVREAAVRVAAARDPAYAEPPPPAEVPTPAAETVSAPEALAAPVPPTAMVLPPALLPSSQMTGPAVSDNKL